MKPTGVIIADVVLGLEALHRKAKKLGIPVSKLISKRKPAGGGK